MTSDVQKHRTLTRWRTLRRAGASVLVLGFLSGCSSVPDAMNPVEWYRSTVDVFSGEEGDSAETTQQADSEVPGENDEFPTLASVPDRPAVQDGEMAEGLIADPNKPEYAGAIARQDEDSGSALSQSSAQTALQPAPPAQPVMPVTPTQSATVMSTTPPAEPAIVSSTQSAAVVAEPSTLVSASQPLVVEAGRLPSGETYEQYRARLMAGLDQSASSPALLSLSSGASATADSGTFNDTVIISASGIQNNQQYSAASAAMAPQSTSASGFLQVGGASGQPLLGAGSVKVATVHFNNGSSHLDLNDRRVLQQVVALQQKQGGTVRVIGHASSRTQSMDPVRHKMVNYQVSVSRADTIARALVRLGAEQNNVLIGAVSDSEPLYYEVMPSGEAGNRRADIYIDS